MDACSGILYRRAANGLCLSGVCMLIPNIGTAISWVAKPVSVGSRDEWLNWACFGCDEMFAHRFPCSVFVSFQQPSQDLLVCLGDEVRWSASRKHEPNEKLASVQDNGIVWRFGFLSMCD